jgi:cytochrome c556
MGLVVLCAALVPHTTSFAETADERLVTIMKLRHERMKNDLGKSLNLIDEEVHGAAPDQAKIARAAHIILATAKEIPAWFPKGTGPETGWGLAKSEIWDNPAAFHAAATRMIDAAAKLVQAANGGQMPEITARFEAAATECQGCHKVFRIPPA